MFRYGKKGDDDEETIILDVDGAATAMTGCRCTVAVVVLSRTALVLLLRRGR